MNDYLKLKQEISDHVGTKIMGALRNHSISKTIFANNCAQLRMLIIQLEDPKDPLNILPLERRNTLDKFFEEVIRLFHNFLTSISTFVDHTRNFIGSDILENGKRKHPGADFIKSEHQLDHQRKINKDFANNPLARFLKECRNYVTHMALPLSSLQQQLLPTAETLEIKIDLKAMLDEPSWHWGTSARTFLEQHQPSIRILKLVDEYEGKMKSFYEDFIITFRQYYGSEISEAEDLMEKMKSTYKAQF